MTKLRQHRLKKNITADEVAYLSGISSIQYNRIERGQSMPRLDTALNIAEALKINIYKLI